MRSRDLLPRPQSMPRNRREHAARRPVAPPPIRRNAPHHSRTAGTGRGRPLGPVPHRPRQHAQPLGRLRVDLLDQPGHRVERPPRILVGHVEQPRVRPFVPRSDQLLNPCTMLAAKLVPKDIVPAHVHEHETPCRVELTDQLLVFPCPREVAPLVVVENAKNTPTPPLTPERRAQLLRHVRREQLRDHPQPLRDALVVGLPRGHGHHLPQTKHESALIRPLSN